jgi:cation diffusion facilitator CzcD-associated flavoprotein CzcO
MSFWSNHMPRGMHLKSEGFASSLYDPDFTFTLGAYCQEKSLPYADIGLPVPIATFISYGLEFQRRYVPQLENVLVTSIIPGSQGFELTTSTGEIFRATRVVVATGIMNFTNLPSVLAGLPEKLVTHSSQHSDLDKFKGRRVAVLGAGASAFDTAALLLQAGADVELIARRLTIDFQAPPVEPRSLVQRIKAPRSGLGTGWRSRMCTDIPLVFYQLPRSLRHRAVERHLGPAPCWFIRDTVEGHVTTHLGATLIGAEIMGDRIRIAFTQQRDHVSKSIEVDHIIAATGYRIAVSRLKFLDDRIQSRVRKVADAPILDRHFQSTIDGLYFIGAIAAYNFGPLLRFAYGANYVAKRVAARLARS